MTLHCIDYFSIQRPQSYCTVLSVMSAAMSLHCIASAVRYYHVVSLQSTAKLYLCTLRGGIITGPPSFSWGNLVNMQFICIIISDNIAEGMPNLQA